MTNDTEITKTTATKECYPGIIATGLTSQVYNTQNPPKDWADISLLIPHEPIRQELDCIRQGLQALHDTFVIAKNGNSTETDEYWKIIYFCEWMVDIFVVQIHTHHQNEEDIYFPWVSKKAGKHRWDENADDDGAKGPKMFSEDHDTLVKQLHAIEDVCEEMIQKRGRDCQDLITKLHQDLFPKFDSELREHLKEEETLVPPILRKYCTHKEEKAIIQKIGQKDGLQAGVKNYLCAILVSMKQWTTPEYRDGEFMMTLPGPLRYLVQHFYLLDYENIMVAKRDAPLLLQEPALEAQRCCKLPFCCACFP